jgi:plasmid maintenance system antidote protein VapI
MNMKAEKTSFARFFREAEKGLTFHVESAILSFTEDLSSLMEAQGVSKSELARRLHCQPAFITKLLSGQNNFTIETMVRIAIALDAKVKIHLQGPGVESNWVDLSPIHTKTASQEAVAVSTGEGHDSARGC